MLNWPFLFRDGVKNPFLGITFFRFPKCVFKSLLLALRSRLFLAKSDILVRKCIKRAGREREGGVTNLGIKNIIIKKT